MVLGYLRDGLGLRDILGLRRWVVDLGQIVALQSFKVAVEDADATDVL